MTFLDAGPVIALFYRDDPFNGAAFRGFEKLKPWVPIPEAKDL